MARLFKDFYTPEELSAKLIYVKNLPEKEYRHFLGTEFLALGEGSKRYLARVFGSSRNTITKGAEEISSVDFEPDYSRQRKDGGGPKKKEEKYPTLVDSVVQQVENHTAGSPTDARVQWTSLKPSEIAKLISLTHDIPISTDVVKRILKKEGYVNRKPIKSIAIGRSPHREEQFKIVNFLRDLFEKMPHNPVLSIDTKKKERLGQLTRNQTVLTHKDAVPEVYSSDYSFLATGKAIPHGIFDTKLNRGYITLGDSHETAEFIVDNLRWWWYNFGQQQYPDANYWLLLCDCGGANGYRHHLFKVLLQQLAKEIGIRIVVAHYPPYCSKYNPIERKFFAHVQRTIDNTILTDLTQVQQLMKKTSHKKGLKTEVRIVNKHYPLKQPSNKEDIDEQRILRHPDLPHLSYTILP